MTRPHALAAIAAALLLGIAIGAAARGAQHAAADPAASFTSMVPAPRTAPTQSASALYGAPPIPAVHLSRAYEPDPATHSPSAVPPVESSPTPTTGTRPAVGAAPHRTATPPVHPQPAHDALSGLATWYAAPAGAAAAGPALRAFLGRSWRGTRVLVCASGRCVRVTLSDWCACGGGRVVDLDAAAFAALAPLSRGVVRVTVARGW